MDHTSDYDYALPKELIALSPLDKRSSSRLLIVAQEVDREHFLHQYFFCLPEILDPDDVLVVNDTQVIKARLHAVKDTGGSAEILIERIEDANTALCQVKVSKPLHPDRTLTVANQEKILVIERSGEFYRLKFPVEVESFLSRYGEVPLPAYIDRPIAKLDEHRYQTVYASQKGAVAAPTAGLHFDDALLEKIKKQGTSVVPITLHIGAGTFQSVRTEKLAKHSLHFERYSIPSPTREAIESRRGRLIAVGTTVVRALEAAAITNCDQGETNLFIRPGFRFNVVDALITNFHLPKSTLLMLVSAFAGFERVRNAYQIAIDMKYRFYSYGDAMFCERFDV